MSEKKEPKTAPKKKPQSKKPEAGKETEKKKKSKFRNPSFKRVKGKDGSTTYVFDPGELNPKQKLFYQSRTAFTAYGGAKGGGKTHAVRVKAIGGALKYPGIKILIMRRTYPELVENHINPIKKICSVLLQDKVAVYNGTTYLMTFWNGSTIKFGHWAGESSEDEYNGQEYDWIFIDEATQFDERAFNFLGGCMRGVGDIDIEKRMYLTCNPGGVGHRWVKRLFIDRNFITGSPDPEGDEDPEDYSFIPATVEDNTALMETSPGYIKQLARMPEDKRRAYRYGDWDAIEGGSYFKNFSRLTHVMKAFPLPKHWTRYRSFDYGLDMFALGWFAVDEDGRAWLYRSFNEKDLTVPEAAKKAIEHSPVGEEILATYAPPDMWARSKDTGKFINDTFTENGLPIIKSSNSRVQGHLAIQTMLEPVPLTDKNVIAQFKKGEAPAMLPGLMFFEDYSPDASPIADIEGIQRDENNPNDCAKIPHNVTHNVDMIRYFCINRVMSAEKPSQTVVNSFEDEEEEDNDYDSYMTGGDFASNYVNF